MSRFSVVLLAGAVALPAYPVAIAGPQSAPAAQDAQKSAGTVNPASKLPALPAGKTTVIGGSIRKVDPVRDRFTLKVFGGKTMRILYDARTQVYRDGTKVPLQDLRPEKQASVETVLDGTDVFAVGIHMLSKAPAGQFQGQVLAFDSAAGLLSLNDSLSRKPVKLQVPAGTPVTRVDQVSGTTQPAALNDLAKGALISVEFRADNKGEGVVSNISILAGLGSTFIFAGNLTFLDVHAGVLALTDSRDGKSYKISFDPGQFPETRDLREGNRVTVKTSFDGKNYTATEITTR